MILIADSGSTKCIWALCNTKGKVIKKISTIGFNPYFIDHISILSHLEESELYQYKNQIKYIFFYGAGCSSVKRKDIIQLPFKEFFKNADITISHDLDAACLAMYNGSPNITCILGTGSNSCFYDGQKIFELSPSLGFIVGDEASGNYFGKKILNLYFNNMMPDELKERLENSFETDIAIINNNLYNTNRANVFLSRYFPFITETRDHPLIQRLINDILHEFIDLHIKCFNNSDKLEINFIGSVAYFLSDEIQDVLKKNNLKTGKILKDPIAELIIFHSEKIKKINS